MRVNVLEGIHNHSQSRGWLLGLGILLLTSGWLLGLGILLLTSGWLLGLGILLLTSGWLLHASIPPPPCHCLAHAQQMNAKNKKTSDEVKIGARARTNKVW